MTDEMISVMQFSNGTWLLESDMGVLNNVKALNQVLVPKHYEPILDTYMLAINELGTIMFYQILERFDNEPKTSRTIERIGETLKAIVQNMRSKYGY